MMMEMNPDVKGDFLNISVEDFIQNKLSDITGCQLVIACDLTVKQSITLGLVTGNFNVPLIIVRQYGLLGYLRVFKKDNCLIEAKPMSIKSFDLRLGSAWPELVAFA